MTKKNVKKEFYLRIIRDGGIHYGHGIGVDVDDAIRAYNVSHYINKFRTYPPGAVTVISVTDIPKKKKKEKRKRTQYEYVCSLF